MTPVATPPPGLYTIAAPNWPAMPATYRNHPQRWCDWAIEYAFIERRGASGSEPVKVTFQFREGQVTCADGQRSRFEARK